MRTTLTLDEDVAALLQQVQKAREAPLKVIVNTALREGLIAMAKPAEPRPGFHTKTFELGECSLPNLDNIAEVLTFGEVEDYR